MPTEKTYDQYRKLLRRGTPAVTQQQVQFLGMFDCVPGNQLYLHHSDTSLLNDPHPEPGILNVAHAVSRDDRRLSFRPLLFVNNGQQTFRQVWFPGYHFDVGGDRNPALNSFALWWMLREAYGNGLELADIKCPGQTNAWEHHGNIGVRLGFMPSIDSEAVGHPTEYLTTKLGLTCKRGKLPNAREVGPVPKLEDLDICPKEGCGEELFDYFGTAEGKRRLAKLMRQPDGNEQACV